MATKTFTIVNSPDGITSYDVELDSRGNPYPFADIAGDNYQLIDGQYVYIP